MTGLTPDDAVSAAARRVTYADAVAALNACVTERGADYVYPFSDTPPYCVNVTRPADGSPGKPACLIGCAYARLGVPVEWMAQENNRTVGSISLASGLTLLGWSIDGDVKSLFTEVQGKQDDGVAWGEAVRSSLVDTP